MSAVRLYREFAGDAHFIPLSGRTGNRRKRFGWWVKGRREALAFRLAPWVAGVVNSIRDTRSQEWRACFQDENDVNPAEYLWCTYDEAFADFEEDGRTYDHAWLEHRWVTEPTRFSIMRRWRREASA